MLCWWAYVKLIQARVPGRGNFNGRITYIRLICDHIYGTFSWLMFHMGGPTPLCALPPLGKWSWAVLEAGWASHVEKQGSKQHFSMSSASLLASRFLTWAPALTFLDNELLTVEWSEDLSAAWQRCWDSISMIKSSKTSHIVPVSSLLFPCLL